MKTIRKTMYVSLIALALVFTGCSKDDDGGGGGGDEYLTAKIDGVNFTGGSEHGDLIAASLNSGVLGLQGSNNAGNAINFSIINYDGEGVYTTGDSMTNMNIIQYIQVSPMGSWVSNGVLATIGIEPGEIKITKQTDTYVEGTFKFVGYHTESESTKTITEGKFRANFGN